MYITSSVLTAHNSHCPLGIAEDKGPSLSLQSKMLFAGVVRLQVAFACLAAVMHTSEARLTHTKGGRTNKTRDQGSHTQTYVLATSPYEGTVK